MKKIFAAFVLIGGLLTSGLASGNESLAVNTTITAAAQAERIAEISARVEVIKSIDKNSVSNREWQQIRKELKEYKKELKAMKAAEPYIYISLTALLIIILLIILL